MTFSIKDFFSKVTKPMETLNLLKKSFLEKLYGSMEQKTKLYNSQKRPSGQNF